MVTDSGSRATREQMSTTFAVQAARALGPEERARRHARRAGRRNTRLWGVDPGLVSIGQAIREERERCSIGAGELASKAGVGKRLLARLEAGKTEADYVSLVRLARALNVTPAVLVRRARALETEGGR